MRGMIRARRIIRNFRRAFHPVAVILIYHRIADVPVDPFRLAVSPVNFASHLEYLRDNYTVLSLVEFVERKEKKSLPHRSVVITFDDGYRDNYQQGWQILDTYRTPATIFVTTGAIGRPCEFWWDELEWIMFSSPELPSELTLNIQGREKRWSFATQELQTRSFWSIHESIRVLPNLEREKALGELSSWAGLQRFGRSQHIAMTQEELHQIAQSELIEIGAHTRTHPILSTLNKEDQSDEIMRGKNELEGMTGKPIKTFSFPYGKPEDYSLDTLEIVRSAGFQTALTTIHGAVDAEDDRFQLKRCEANNWDRPHFEAKLAAYFNA